MKRAYRVTAYGESGIIAAETPGQAKFRVFRVCRDLGFLGPNELGEVKVRRAPEHDGWAELDSTGVCWQESLLPAAAPKQRELIQ